MFSAGSTSSVAIQFVNSGKVSTTNPGTNLYFAAGLTNSGAISLDDRTAILLASAQTLKELGPPVNNYTYKFNAGTTFTVNGTARLIVSYPNNPKFLQGKAALPFPVVELNTDVTLPLGLNFIGRYFVLEGAHTLTLEGKDAFLGQVGIIFGATLKIAKGTTAEVDTDQPVATRVPQSLVLGDMTTTGTLLNQGTLFFTPAQRWRFPQLATS